MQNDGNNIDDQRRPVEDAGCRRKDAGRPAPVLQISDQWLQDGADQPAQGLGQKQPDGDGSDVFVEQNFPNSFHKFADGIVHSLGHRVIGASGHRKNHAPLTTFSPLFLSICLPGERQFCPALCQKAS